LVEEVVKKYEKDIKFQFRHLPLTSIHKNAFASSRAAEAAGKQDKFFDMYRVLYQNQQAWAESNNVLSIFETYAKQLGLNVEQFKQDYASRDVNSAINADISEFKKTGEKMSTPTFFLNGKSIQPKSVEEFNKLIEDEIAKQQNQ
jgi:protein-disulfide isomerase